MPVKIKVLSRSHRYATAGFSLLEVLVALAILMAGIVGILQFFPTALQASHEAALRSRAVLLAQQKAEELRRDADQDGQLIEAIAQLSSPTDPVVFPEEERLMYQYHSQSVLDPDGDPSDPQFAHGVPRVVIRLNPERFGDADVLFELRFDYDASN